MTGSVLYLAIAIVIEVIGTTFLKLSEGFSKPLYSAAALASYAIAIFLLSLAIREIPVGIAYAIWAGVGVALISIIGWLVFDERLNPATVIGIVLVVAGVVLLQLNTSEV